MGAKKVLMRELPEWANSVPYQVKGIAIRDAYFARNAGVKKFKSTGNPFKLKFRSKKTPKQSCFIPSTGISKKGIFPRILGELYYREKLPENIKDSRLVYQNDKWFLHVAYSKFVKNTDNQGRLVALDPGVRTFLTGFSENKVFKIGEEAFKKIAKLFIFMDKLASKITLATNHRKQRLKKAMKRMRFRVSCLIDELHFKTAKFLADNFDVVILPTFKTSEMVSKLKRKIRSKTVRAMLNFSFFKFSQRLKNKLVGKVLVRCSEAYTSKTASWTGEIKQIGSAKTISSGSITLDRDINGARGIFLRALRDSSLLANNQYAYATDS